MPYDDEWGDPIATPTLDRRGADDEWGAPLPPAAPTVQSRPFYDPNRTWGDFAGDIAGSLADQFYSQWVGGARDFAESATKLGFDIGELTGINQITGASDRDAFDKVVPEIDRPGTIVGEFGRAMAQVAPAAITGTFAGQAAGLSAPAANLAGFAGGDFVAFDPEQGNLSSLVQSIIPNPLTGALATGPETDPWQGRLNNVAEGLLIGELLNVFVRGAGRGAQAFRDALPSASGGPSVDDFVGSVLRNEDAARVMRASGIDPLDPEAAGYVGRAFQRVMARREAEAARQVIPVTEGEIAAREADATKAARDAAADFERRRRGRDLAALTPTEMTQEELGRAIAEGIVPPARPVPDVIPVGPGGRIPGAAYPDARLTPLDEGAEAGRARQVSEESKVSSAFDAADIIRRRGEEFGAARDRRVAIEEIKARIGEDPIALIERDLGLPRGDLDAMSPDGIERLVASVQRRQRAERPGPVLSSSDESGLYSEGAPVSPVSRPMDEAARSRSQGEFEDPVARTQPTETELDLRDPARYQRTQAGTSDRPFQSRFEEGISPDQARFFEQRARDRAEALRRAREEDVLRRWEEDANARNARETSGRAQDEPAAAAYEKARFSPTAKAGDGGRFEVDEWGYVLSDVGGPVRFADQRQAAKWIMNVGHKVSPDQVFEIANHPRGGFTARQRDIYANEPPRAEAESAAPRAGAVTKRAPLLSAPPRKTAPEPERPPPAVQEDVRAPEDAPASIRDADEASTREDIEPDGGYEEIIIGPEEEAAARRNYRPRPVPSEGGLKLRKIPRGGLEKAKEAQQQAAKLFSDRADRMKEAGPEGSAQARDKTNPYAGSAEDKYGTKTRAWANGWDAAWESGGDTHGKGEFKEGFEAYRAWEAEQEYKFQPNRVTIERPSGGKTTFTASGTDEAALRKTAQSILKANARTFYSNPIFDPEIWKSLRSWLMSNGWVRRQADLWESSLKIVGEGLSDALKNNPVRAILDFGREIFYTNDGVLRALAHRFKVDGSPNPHILKIADDWFARPGRADEVGVGRTYHEAIDMRIRKRMNEIGKVFKPLDALDNARRESALRQITAKLRSGNVSRGASTIDNVAAQLRDMFNEEHAYLKDAGVEVGYQRNYVPREFDRFSVIREPKKFQAAVAREYQRLGSTPQESREQAEALFDAIVDEEMGFARGKNDFVVSSASAGKSNFERGRSFGPEADKNLAEFYISNPVELAQEYVSRVTRRAEWARRMGANLEKWQEIVAGLDATGAIEAKGAIVDAIQSAIGAFGRPRNRAARAGLGFLQNWSHLMFLSKATLTSLSEPAIAAVRTGNVADAFRAYTYTLQEISRMVTGKGTSAAKEAAAMAEDLGLVANIADDMMLQRASGDMEGGRAARFIATSFFTKTGLHHFTTATRVASMRVGQIFLRRLVKEMVGGGSAATKQFLGELGVPEARQGAFARWADALSDGMPDADDIARGGEYAEDYRTALNRIVNQVIMEPSGAQRPRWANHSVGRLVYALQSYLYSFQKNVLNRMGGLAYQAVTRGDLTMNDRLRFLAPAAMFPLAVLAQYASQGMRAAVFDDPGRKPEDKEKTALERVMRALSGSGAFGTLDGWVNRVFETRYQKSSVQSVVGAIFGRMGDAVDAYYNLASERNSPNTNTAERKAARLTYDVLVAPAINAALAIVPGAVAPVAAAGMQYVSSPQAREGFVSSVAGDPDWMMEGQGPGRPERPRRPERPERPSR